VLKCSAARVLNRKRPAREAVSVLAIDSHARLARGVRGRLGISGESASRMGANRTVLDCLSFTLPEERKFALIRYSVAFGKKADWTSGARLYEPDNRLGAGDA